METVSGEGFEEFTHAGFGHFDARQVQWSERKDFLRRAVGVQDDAGAEGFMARHDAGQGLFKRGDVEGTEQFEGNWGCYNWRLAAGDLRTRCVLADKKAGYRQDARERR